MIPSQVQYRFHEALRHYDEEGKCMFCHKAVRRIDEQTRVVQKNEHFVAMEAFAAGHALRDPHLPSATWPALAKFQPRK